MNTVAVCIQINNYSFSHVKIQDITLTNLSFKGKSYGHLDVDSSKALYTVSFL